MNYYLDRSGQQAAHPTSISVDRGDKATTLWATRGDGVIDWQQLNEGERRNGSFQPGTPFENIVDQNKDGKADVLVQGYLGVAANRFEQL